MKILYLLPNKMDFERGVTGDIVQQWNIISRLGKRGHNIRLFAYEGLHDVVDISSEEALVLKKTWTNSIIFKIIARMIWRLQLLLRTPYLNCFSNIERYDAISQVILDYDIVFERLALYKMGVALASKVNHKPYVIFFDADPIFELDYTGIPIKGLLRWNARQMLKFSLALADRVICVSSVVSNQLITHYQVEEKKIIVLPNAVDVQVIYPQNKSQSIINKLGIENNKVIMFVGSFCPWHDVTILIESFTMVLDRIPSARLVCVGDGEGKQQCVDFVQSLGIGPQVIFTGNVPRSEMSMWMSVADIMVAPYPKMDVEFWGSPMKIFEYMAAGKPIIASAVGQLKAIIKNGWNGVLVEPGDVNSLSEKLIELLSDEALATSLGYHARDNAVQNYSWEKYISILESQFDRCVIEKR